MVLERVVRRFGKYLDLEKEAVCAADDLYVGVLDRARQTLH